jgi:hypothetical protein
MVDEGLENEAVGVIVSAAERAKKVGVSITAHFIHYLHYS